MNTVRLPGAMALLTVLLATTVATAHPSHVTIAEAEFNKKTGNLEVALRVHPIDLERALCKRTKTRVDLDKTADIDKLIVDYLQTVFVVQDSPKAKPYKLKWVGKEISVKAAWLYFEVPKIKQIEGRLFSNEMFFETLEHQVNTINFRHGKLKATLQLTADQPRQTATFKKATTTRSRQTDAEEK